MKTILALTTLSLALLINATYTLAATLPTNTDTEESKGFLADRDGNRISDQLQQRLDTVSPSEPLAVVVTFSLPASAAAAQRAVGPFKVKHEFSIIKGFAATMTAGQARALAKAPGVFRVEEDFQVKTMINAANRDFGTEKARIDYAVDGTGVGICIIDTGVDPGHEQLNDGGKVVSFVDYVNGRQTAYDDHGHGTHVAAIAAGDGSGGESAARLQGVAPGAAIYAAKVLNASGSGDDSDVIAGVQWCASQSGVNIISMSLGSGSASDGQDSLSQAVNSAVASGKIVVVAAGNSGDGNGTVGSPGAATAAITVGAVAEWSAPATAANHSNGIYLAPFSSRGPTLGGEVKPDICAPGISVTSAAANTLSNYVTWSGTSMATPFVSGAIALAVQDRIAAMTPAYIKELLITNAKDLGPEGTDNDWGAGLIDGFLLAARARGDMSAPPTPFPTFQRIIKSIPINSTAEVTFNIASADLGVPIAATLIILNGEAVCIYGSALICDLLGGWAWTPDIDAELIHPNGAVLARSECPLTGDCGAMGRQETLSYLPTATQDIGTYLLRIYQFSSDPGGAQQADVAIDLSTGPVVTTQPPDGNAPPQAADDSYTTRENATLNVPAPGLLGNDSDIDGDTLTAVPDTGPLHGILTLNSDGSFTYAPAPNYSGQDSFTYQAYDGNDYSRLATVNITILPGLHVGDLDGSSTVGRTSWTATVTIAVHDAAHKPVNGAIVSAKWEDGKTGSCTTKKGLCKLTSNKIWLNTNVNEIDFTVTKINGVDANPLVNHDSDADSNGTTITVRK